MSARLSTTSEQIELVMMEDIEVAYRREYAKKVRVWHQMRALFLKDLTLRRRAYGTTLCQLLVPIVLLGLAGLLQLIANAILSSFNPSIPGTDRPSFPMDASWMVSCGIDQSSNPTGCVVDSFNLGYYLENNFDKLIEYNMFQWVPHDLSVHNTNKSCDFTSIPFLNLSSNLSRAIQLEPQFNLYNIPMIYYVDNTDEHLGSLPPDGESSGFLGKAVPSPGRYKFTRNFTINPQWSNVCFEDDAEYDEESLITLPFFLPMDSERQLQNHLIRASNKYISLAGGGTELDDQFSRNYEAFPYNQDTYKGVLSSVKDENYTDVKPYAGVIFNQLSNTSLRYTLVVPELLLFNNLAGLDCNGSRNESDETNYSCVVDVLLDLLANSEVPRTQSLINLLNNAYLRNMTGNAAEGDTMIEMFLTALPSLKIKLQVDVATVLGGILYPFVTSFLLPVFIATLVYDKREKHLIMMLQNGLTRPVYWLITYCFDYLFYMIIMVLVMALSLLIRIRLFSQTNALILIVVYFFWGHALVVLGFFLSNIFQRPRTATVVGYLLVMVSVIVSQLLSGLNIFATDKNPPFFYMLYPPFAYYRLLFYMNNACVEFQCFGTDHFGWGSNEAVLFSDAVLYLVLGTLMFWLLFLYLSYIFPGEFGVRKPFHFPITDLIKCATGRDVTKCNYGDKRYYQMPTFTNSHSQDSADLEDTNNSSLHYSSSLRYNEEVDDDVQAEADLIAENFDELNAPIVMQRLRKEFPPSAGKPPHIAVHGFSLAIQRGECFGLLGPNGAGKTTLISLLTGLYEPTNGTAHVAGYDLATEMSSVHQHIGVCPQFDIQHASLTAKEHLLFYGRLRGLKWRHEKTVVENALKQVNLLDAANKKSKQLSGGMKRRLSVAMACVGSPDILILDEPTTGLDPSSRRQVWDVINNVKHNRSVILTTHAMEEADHLCTRIGIMNYGKLRCLGSQNRLKTKYGSGYQLQLNCMPQKLEEVEAFISAKLPNMVHVETYNGKISYKIEKEQLVVSELFGLLDSVKMQLGISDWGIKRTTLEDVFLNIVAKHRDQRTPLDRGSWLSWLPCIQKSGPH